MATNKTKISGNRSIGSKCHRLAYELENDAQRVRYDYSDGAQNYVADTLKEISRMLGNLARKIEAEGK